MVLAKAVFSLLAVVAVVSATRQYVHVKGQVLCKENVPAMFGLLQLEDKDWLNKDDILAVNQTDLCGHFDIAGAHDEFVTISPTIVFTLFCPGDEDNSFCIHTVEMPISKSAVSIDSDNVTVFNVRSQLLESMNKKRLYCTTKESKEFFKYLGGNPEYPGKWTEEGFDAVCNDEAKVDFPTTNAETTTTSTSAPMTVKAEAKTAAPSTTPSTTTELKTEATTPSTTTELKTDAPSTTPSSTTKLETDAPSTTPSSTTKLETDAPSTTPSSTTKLETDAPSTTPSSTTKLETDAPSTTPSSTTKLETDAPSTTPSSTTKLETDAPSTTPSSTTKLETEAPFTSPTITKSEEDSGPNEYVDEYVDEFEYE